MLCEGKVGMDKELNNNPPIGDYRFNLGNKQEVITVDFCELGNE